MQQSYTKNYIKIYIWQGISLVLNFLSMFIVLPYLSIRPDIFGIYSVCISVTIFLAYADLGFMGAGQKYAAEHLSREERSQEAEVIGFVSFILLIFLVLLSMAFIYLSLHPWLLIKNLGAGEETSIASALLLIMALSTPITLFQRILQIIYGIRLEDYIVQRINIGASLIRILSILWFFRTGHYNIVGYFLFAQILGYLAATISLIVARRRYNYNFKLLVTSIRFSKTILLKTKKLALSGLYLTAVWILYYELDPTVIGKFIGAKQAAIYAVGLPLQSFLRGIFGVLFFPFFNRRFHFIGTNDVNGLKTFCLHVIIITAPLVVMPILTIALLARPLVLSWVGVNYVASIEITQYLVLCYLFSFISYPTSELLFAQERINIMNLVGTLLPIVYWGGIVLTYSILGLKSFAIFKFLNFAIVAVVYCFITVKFLNLNFAQFFKKVLRPMLLPAVFLVLAVMLVENFLPCTKSKLNLLIVTSTAGGLILAAFVLQYFSSPYIKEYATKLLKYV